MEINNNNNNDNQNKVEEILVDNVISTFISITSASIDDALTFLSDHAFEIEPAIEAYYDHCQQEAEAAAAAAAIPNQPSIVPNPSPSVVPAAGMSSREDKNKKKAAAGSSGGGRGGIRTLADLNRQSGPGSNSDSDEPQEYYTGGEKR